MAKCDFCAELTIDKLEWNQDMKFHPDLSSLRDSAKSGCPFCALCYTGVQNKCDGNSIAELLAGKTPSSHGDGPFYPSIWLHGQLFPVKGDTRQDPNLAVDRVDQGVWVSCGQLQTSAARIVDEETNGHLSPIQFMLSSYAFIHSPAASLFPGQSTNFDPNPDTAFNLARARLEECRLYHPRCATPSCEEMPTRVVAVGATGSPRLVLTNGLREPYMALSYCWGPATDTFKLTHETLRGMLQEIEYGKLTKTHQETLVFARALDMQYVWIDALCIIQGDPDDWTRESQRMGRVYGNAAFTLVAGRYSDARHGFMTPTNTLKTQQCAIPLSSGSKDALYLDLPLEATSTPDTVSTRGWCFQESILSNRCILFDERLSFECRTWLWSEVGNCDIQKNKQKQTFLPFNPTSSPVGTWETKDEVFNMWYWFIFMYSRRNLSNPNDVFAAIAAVAKPTQEILQSRYLAGLWEDDLIRGLLWRPRHHMCRLRASKGPAIRPKPTRLAPSPVIRAPSWSWASIEGGAGYYHSTKTKTWEKFQEEGFAKVKPILAGGWTEDISGDVSILSMPFCELRLLGQVAKVTVTGEPEVEYLKRPTTNRVWKAQRDHSKRTCMRLLSISTTEESGSGNEGVVEHIVGIGSFDVQEEARDEVWCLGLIDGEGLMLIKHGEQWKRIGWFISEDMSWFEGREHVDIRLV